MIIHIIASIIVYQNSEYITYSLENNHNIQHIN